ncbi:uncharacterized protein PITG_08055 [Phytophthora infestans T30-4]|uniref:Uncharacterized protein n=2 Tax=Phytophthora infestans TaxID=4787 RepID=D0N9D4_PHYIT|nr:uncharacterized protein PITG_08055 [Phytophthora infestans T30-4]EEY54422.1 conserved hypothetical protein [Phytophthora infestans T30-4]KAF4029033.1 hypothetical protein GN244_ATG19284 [Phytophthora infestans]KAF4130386.1 hypothetical protein GN958_ATG20429 [Phytophthora infestans]|eukprot:XP_002904244.1 conserved hypothetical protein [Phytophthora infestans T30-4]
MTFSSTITCLSCFITLIVTQVVTAWSGSVTFYYNRWHDKAGGTYTYHIDDSQQCINLSCFNDRATSPDWSDIVKWGAFDGKSRIAFYTGKDCTGTVSDWDIKHPNGYPGNFFLDGIDKQISSFMIWQFDKKAKSTSLPCPWDFECCL